MNQFPPSPDPRQDPDLPDQTGGVPPEIPPSNPPNRTIPPTADHPGPASPDPVDPAEEEDAPVDSDVDGFE